MAASPASVRRHVAAGRVRCLVRAWIPGVLADVPASCQSSLSVMLSAGIAVVSVSLIRSEASFNAVRIITLPWSSEGSWRIMVLAESLSRLHAASHEDLKEIITSPRPEPETPTTGE